jgi:WS/DGAT/MGAT family acyltransferase
MIRLSATDSLFLYADSKTAPMNMGSVQILKLPGDYEGDFFENYKKFVEERLYYIPKLTMKLVDDGLGLPCLIPSEDVDIDYHVRRTHVKSDDEKELFRKLGRLQHRTFDFDKPLFMFYVVEGLKDGRVAIMQKFHHAMADGNTSVKIMTLFSDGSLEHFGGGSEPEDEVESPGRLRRMLSGGLEDVRRISASLSPVVGAATKFFSEDGKKMLSHLTDRPVTIFNKPLSEKRLFAMHRWSLDKFTTVRRAAGLTFNEIGLTLLSGALRRYLDERDALPDKSLVCNVPVAIKTETGTTGNAVLAMWVDIGTQLEKRSDRIESISADVESGKRLLTEVQEAATAGQGVQLPSLMMRSMGMSLGSSLVNRYNPPPGNVAMSSVPVPAGEITVAGAKAESLYGMPMILHGQAVSTTISTYQDDVVLSILCCEEALPDPERLLAYMEQELDEMSAELKTKRVRGIKSKGTGKKRKSGVSKVSTG